MSVRALSKSIKFYVDGLGFVERVSWGKAPKRTVLLDTGDGNYFEISARAGSNIYEEGVFKHIALRVDDCKVAIELARKAGAEVTMETRGVNLTSEPSIPIRIAFFKGPDGEITIEDTIIRVNHYDNKTFNHFIKDPATCVCDHQQRHENQSPRSLHHRTKPQQRANPFKAPNTADLNPIS